MLVYILLVALDWPMYGKDLYNTHRQEGKGAMTSAVIKWSYNTGAFGGHIETPPTLADINNDGYLEVTALSVSARVNTFSYNGVLLWTYPLGPFAFPLITAAATDIDGDAFDEIIVGSKDPKVYAINHDGSLLWSYTMGGSTDRSGPAVADIDGDGFYEIIIGSTDNKLYVLNHDGSLLWSYTTGGQVCSSPAVADIDNDGFYEIVFGSADNQVYALNHDGSLLWTYAVGGGVGPPVVADINNDNLYEIIFASEDDRVYVVNHLGIFSWSFLTNGLGAGYIERVSPAVADIDGDGYDEIIVGSCPSGYTNGVVYALNHDGTLYWDFNMVDGGVHCAPAIADVDGDNWYEIIVGKIKVGNVSQLYCLNHDGTVCWDITLDATDIHDASIGDIDCDSCLEVIVGTYNDNYVYVLDDPSNTSGCSPAGVEESSAEVYPRQYNSLELKVIGDEVIFSIPSAGVVSLKLYDICGRVLDCLIESYITKGAHTVRLPNLGSGIYFVVLTHNGVRLTDKVVLIKSIH